MKKIVLTVRLCVKERLRKTLRRCRDAGTKQRFLIILNLVNRRSGAETAQVLQVHNTTGYRVLNKFRRFGEAGL